MAVGGPVAGLFFFFWGGGTFKGFCYFNYLIYIYIYLFWQLSNKTCFFFNVFVRSFFFCGIKWLFFGFLVCLV